LNRATIRLDLIERISRKCFVPLTIGGGIRDSNFIATLLKVGADKICVNSIAIEDPEFVSRVARKYGSQFITVSIDAKKVGDKYESFILNGRLGTGLTPADLAKRVENLGAGEIFLNSIDRDGSKQGYDIDLLKSVSEAVSIPVIACGGVGKASDLATAITHGKCQAASAANIFNHTELSTISAKAIMKRNGIPIRIDSSVKYENFNFDHLDRPI
jgi:cyclase